MITLTIDGKKVSLGQGTSVLDAARKAGVSIPTLCYDSRLRPYGACRLCIVEDRNNRGHFMPSCFTPACEGMEILTETPELIEARKTQLQLILINHPLDCPVCDKAGECALQDLVMRYNVSESPYHAEIKDRGIDRISPLIERNLNRCILCGRCVRICAELQGRYEIDFINRGIEMTIGTNGQRPLDCDFCGLCLSTCPVGALTDTLFKDTTRVWKLEKHETVCSHCGLGCSIILNTEDGRIKRATPPVSDNGNMEILCVRGCFGWTAYQHPERLLSPRVQRNDRQERATWSEALAFAADKIGRIHAEHGGDAFAALSSDVLTTEEAYAYQEFFRTVLGSSNMGSITADGYRQVATVLTEHLGMGWKKGSQQDFDEADTIIVIGGGAVEFHPVLKPMINTFLNDEEKELVVISPWRDYLLQKATLPIEIKPTLLHSFYRKLREVLPARTENLEFDASAYGVEHAAPAKLMSLLEPDRNILLLVVPSLFGNNDELGHLAVHLHSLVRAVLPLGAGLNSFGALLRAGFSSVFQPGGIPTEKTRRGLEGTEEILSAIEKGTIKALYLLGDDPLAEYPDPERMQTLLRKLNLIVYQSPYEGPTASLAQVVLPSATTPETKGTFVSLFGNTHTIQRVLKTPDGVKTDGDILEILATAMGIDETAFTAETAGQELNDMEASAGGEPVHMPGHSSDTGFDRRDDIVETSRDYPFMMVPVPSMFGDGTTSLNSPQLLALKDGITLLMNPDDFEAMDLEKNEIVTVTSPSGSARGKAAYAYTVMKGTVLVANITGNREGLTLLKQRTGIIPVNIARVNDHDR